MIGDPERLRGLLKQMDAKLAEISETDARYQMRLDALKDLHAYEEGRFTLFPQERQETAIPAAEQMSLTDLFDMNISEEAQTAAKTQKEQEEKEPVQGGNAVPGDAAEKQKAGDAAQEQKDGAAAEKPVPVQDENGSKESPAEQAGTIGIAEVEEASAFDNIQRSIRFLFFVILASKEIPAFSGETEAAAAFRGSFSGIQRIETAASGRAHWF